MEKRTRPEPEIRLYAQGREVDLEGFLAAVQELGHQARVVADPPPPTEARYTLTAKGRAALAQEESR